MRRRLPKRSARRWVSEALFLASYLRRSDSCRTPLPSIRSTHRDPCRASEGGDGSTTPEANNSSLLPCSSASSSNAVRLMPSRRVTGSPRSSGAVSPWDKQSISPKRPLKSALTRNRFNSDMIRHPPDPGLIPANSPAHDSPLTAPRRQPAATPTPLPPRSLPGARPTKCPESAGYSSPA
jgi:hypothetical protein